MDTKKIRPGSHSVPGSLAAASTQGPADELIDQAEEMIWRLLDDNLAGADFERLEQMLFELEPVRRRYLECVQFHVDLHNMFDSDSKTNTSSKQVPTPDKLGSLLPLDMPGTLGTGTLGTGAMGMPPISLP